jgi:hypothetical protein
MDRHVLIDDAANHTLHRVRLHVLLGAIDALNHDMLASTRRNTVPRLPLSLPVMTMTSSPLRILFHGRSLQHFRRQRHDLHEALGAQLARHRAKDTRANRLQLVIEEHCRIAIELDQRAIRTTNALGRANTTTAL